MPEDIPKKAAGSIRPFGLDREMGYSRKEFFQQLPRALSDYDYSIDEDDVTVTLDRGTVLIHVGAEDERRLSEFVRIPILPVSIRFESVDDGARTSFLRRFNGSYMKGLG